MKLHLTTRVTADGRIRVSDGQGTTATYPLPLGEVTRADHLTAVRTYLAEQKGIRGATIREGIPSTTSHHWHVEA